MMNSLPGLITSTVGTVLYIPYTLLTPTHYNLIRGYGLCAVDVNVKCVQCYEDIIMYF